jgi:glutamate-1-semialdehyde 2,1-aminomutase
MKTYTYTKSTELFKRALKVTPGGIQGHLGPAAGCFVPVSAYPLFASRAEGAYLWDADGNRFIDYMCAYGPNILGYRDPDVDEAAFAQAKLGDCTTAPMPVMIDLAELMVDTVKSADWTFFAKNGGDVTSFSVMIARASKVITTAWLHGLRK